MLKTQQGVRFDWVASAAVASHVLLAYLPVRFLFKCLLASTLHASWPYMLAFIIYDTGRDASVAKIRRCDRTLRHSSMHPTWPLTIALALPT